MTEQHRPQSRLIPAMVAALVGVLLGALVVVVGVLAGQRGGCCCTCYGPVCVEAVRESRAPVDRTLGRPDDLHDPDEPAPGRDTPEAYARVQPPPTTPPVVPPWVRPDSQTAEVSEPATLAMVALGAVLIGRMAA